MKTYGIICEYNPFHNGHVHQIEETRKNGATHIVAIMSGNYVQRGDVAIVDKFKRAQIAVNNGVDLVIELPVVYSLSSAEMFARAGIMMLGALGCVDGISFGSESGDIGMLRNAAMASLSAANPEKIKPLLESGMSYPQAMQQVIANEAGPLVADVFDTPNNTLAVEYLKAMKILGLELETFTVKRMGAEHDSFTPEGSFASGTLLREMIENDDDISEFVPKDMADAVAEYRDYESLCYFDNLERPFLYTLRTCGLKDIADTPDVGQGLHNRIFEMGRMMNSLDDFLENVNTKRYTLAKMRRILLNLLIGVKTTDLQIPPPFGRVLAFNERGTEILKKSNEAEQNKYTIPFRSSMKDLLDLKVPQINRYIDLTTRATDIYGLASRNVAPCARDFISKVEIQ